VAVEHASSVVLAAFVVGHCRPQLPSPLHGALLNAFDACNDAFAADILIPIMADICYSRLFEPDFPNVFCWLCTRCVAGLLNV